jgi:hypothetical protein
VSDRDEFRAFQRKTFCRPRIAFGGVPLRAFAARSVLLSAFIAAAAVLPAQAQAPQPAAPGQGEQAMQLAPPKAYKPIPVTAVQPNNDPSFAAFRKHLAEIANKKDRAALAELTVSNFFWISEQGDKADNKKSGIDNLAAAIELDDKDGSGWEDVMAAADEPTLQAVPQREGIMCSPAIPTFDEAAAEGVAKDTDTSPAEWAYGTNPNIEVHDAAKADAPIIDKLGQILVRVMPEEPVAGAPEQPFVRVVTPAGKVGFVRAELIAPLFSNQLCYTKDAGGWKIAGYAGGN